MFTNTTIILLFAVLLAVYYCLPGGKQQRVIVLGMNYLFYFLLCGWAVIWLAALALYTWAAGRALADGGKKPALFAAILVPIAALLGVRLLPQGAPSVLLPVGLSFFGMQIISYLVDVYRGHPGGSLMDAVLYISFFPTVTSGPILKWHDAPGRLVWGHRFDKVDFSTGLQRFTVGLIKKLVIADRVGIGVNAVYGNPEAYSGLSLLTATVGYGIQLWMDFSGYSDMAIGAARMMGITLPENFNMPYLSQDLSEFWKRWHISLSSWLTEYVYIPLGGSRRGKLRTRLNSLVTMTVSGLWHGFSWNFVLWGLLHGVFLNLQKAAFGSRKHTGAAGVLRILLNTVLVLLLWIPFRADTFGAAWTVLYRIVLMAPGIRYYQAFTLIYGAVLAGFTVYSQTAGQGNRPNLVFDLATFHGKFLFCLELLILGALASFGSAAFIYAGF